MDESSPPQGDFSEELRSLGENLKSALHSAWESDERKKVQAEIETGLADLNKMLTATADEFEAEKVAQDIKSEFKGFRERVETGEVAAQARSDLLKVLQAINTELTKFQNQWTAGSDSETAAETTDE